MSRRYLIAQELERCSQLYEVEWEVAAAILHRESRFNLAAINWNSFDFGMGQLNYRTIIKRKVNLPLLMTDEPYCIDQTFRILSELKKKYAKIDARRGRKWYSRYNSFNPSKRQIYSHGVEASVKILKRLSISKTNSCEGEWHYSTKIRRGRSCIIILPH